MEILGAQALKEASKYTEMVEIFVEKEQSLQLDLKRDNIDFAKDDLTIGVGIRLIIDGKMGFSYTSNPEEIEKAVKRAVSNSKANEMDENFSLAFPSKYPIVEGTYDAGFKSLEVDDAVNFARSMLDTVAEEKCEPTSGGFSTGMVETLVLNSNGVECSNISTGFGGYIAVNAEKDGEKSTAYDSKTSCFMDINPEELAKHVCGIAKDSIGGEHVETKDMDVILDYHAAAGLLGTFISAINADNVQRGRSILADKTGEEVLSPNISIFDDGVMKSGLNSSRCDGEGTASEKTTIIKNGVLKGFIYDLYTASKGKTSSTGNGNRSSFAETSTVGVTNLVVDFNNERDLSELKDAILVTDVLGAHTANPISGDFSVEANNSFIIKNGEITAPVNKAMLSGNIFESLKTAEAMKSPVRQYGPFVIPKILSHNMRVVG
jgi:PmbA protein